MGLFSKKKKEQEFPKESRIGQKTNIKGEVSLSSHLTLQGSLEGKILSSAPVVLAAGSTAKGEITASLITSEGKIEGDVHARNGITLKKGSSTEGRFFIHGLKVEEGAIVSGEFPKKR